MNKLNFYNTDPIAELTYPEHQSEVSPNSPALEVFTDFYDTPPMVIEDTLPVSSAEHMMLKSHVRLKLVVNSNDHFLGVVSLDDLNRQEVIKRVSEGYSRSELTVSDFMKPRESLMAFSYTELLDATIHDVIEALKESGQQHCLVLDRDRHEIRGIISASDIARKLKLPVNIRQKSNFVEIFKVIQKQLNGKIRLAG